MAALAGRSGVSSLGPSASLRTGREPVLSPRHMPGEEGHLAAGPLVPRERESCALGLRPDSARSRPHRSPSQAALAGNCAGKVACAQDLQSERTPNAWGTFVIRAKATAQGHRAVQAVRQWGATLLQCSGVATGRRM